MQEKSPLALTLISLRKQKHVTSQQVADAIGIKGTTYRRYEISTEPKLEILAKISDYFGVSVDYLVRNNNGEASSNDVYVCTDGKKFFVEKKQFELDENEMKIIKSLRELDDKDISEVNNFIDWLRHRR